MKVFASLFSICLVIFLAVYFIMRDPAVPSRPNPGDETNTRSSSRSSSNQKAIRNSYIDDKWKSSVPESESERSYLEADTTEEKLIILGKLQASDPDSLALVLRRALCEPNENLRVQAVLMTSSLYSLPEDATDILTAASYDESAEVRNHSLEMTLEQAPDTKLGVFSVTIESPFPEVRESTVLELGRIRSKASLMILMQGLGSKDSVFVARVNDELGNIIDKRFESTEEATQWWNSNSEKFDERLIRMVD